MVFILNIYFKIKFNKCLFYKTNFHVHSIHFHVHSINNKKIFEKKENFEGRKFFYFKILSFYSFFLSFFLPPGKSLKKKINKQCSIHILFSVFGISLGIIPCSLVGRISVRYTEGPGSSPDVESFSLGWSLRLLSKFFYLIFIWNLVTKCSLSIFIFTSRKFMCW